MNESPLYNFANEENMRKNKVYTQAMLLVYGTATYKKLFVSKAIF